jgi:DNA-binding transcriptional regulator YbjK
VGTLTHNQPLYLQLLTEAMKHAYADRAEYLGDTDFVKVPIPDLAGYHNRDQHASLFSTHELKREAWMPKQVDHDERRQDLADAVWRVIERDGLEAASLRGVADEAGWSVGALRYYFATQSDLLIFAMELVMHRVSGRLRAAPADVPPLQRAEQALHEVLPLDATRRAEMQVWLAFTARALFDPTLRPLRDRAHAELRDLCRGVARLLGASSPLRDGDRLHALVDGLALHAVLAPTVTTPARQREILAAEIDAICHAR